jgi:hypothetical protein
MDLPLGLHASSTRASFFSHHHLLITFHSYPTAVLFPPQRFLIMMNFRLLKFFDCPASSIRRLYRLLAPVYEVLPGSFVAPYQLLREI